MKEVKLPEWPDIAHYGVPGGMVNGPRDGERGITLIQWGYSHLQEEVMYERARAEAAIARLKVVVEAFKSAPAVLRSAEKWAHGHELRVDLLRIANLYDEALAQIEGK